MTVEPGHYNVYVGTYTADQPHPMGRAEGIYVYRLDPMAGTLYRAHTVTGVPNPSYLALDPTRRFLYAVSELPEYEGQATGAVSAFAVDPETGNLTLLNRQPTGGTAPCYVSVDRTGRWVLVANYSSGSVAVFPVQADGRLGEASDFVQHEGSGPNQQRQRGPHAHCIVLDPAERFALVCDLGLDKVLVYRFDASNGTLTPNDPPSVSTAPGAGPRHLDFHPNGRFVYVINELGNTLGAYAYDAERGALTEIETLSTLPEDFIGRSHCADIHVTASGRFVYGSNRGHDSLAIFAIDEASGRLSPVGHESTQGQIPRNFIIDPNDTFLFAANQNTDSIATFWIDTDTGQLSLTGQLTEVPSPVCLKIALPGHA